MNGNNLNKVLGAINLIDGPASLASINDSILRVGDIGFVVTKDSFYIYKVVEGNALPVSVEPFSLDNPPLYIKPSSSDTTNKRWMLIWSSLYVIGDWNQIVGAIFTKELKVSEDFTITLLDGTVLGQVKDGVFYFSNLKVDNLTLSKLNNIATSMIMLRDGSRKFLAPISGEDPTEPEHLATRRYIDSRLKELDPTVYMKRDGTTAFVAPVYGINPSEDLHLATKWYVDNCLQRAVDSITDFLNKERDIIKDIDISGDKLKIYYETGKTKEITPNFARTADRLKTAIQIAAKESDYITRKPVAFDGSTNVDIPIEIKFPYATELVAIAGTSTNTIISPKTLKYVLDHYQSPLYYSKTEIDKKIIEINKYLPVYNIVQTTKNYTAKDKDVVLCDTKNNDIHIILTNELHAIIDVKKTHKNNSVFVSAASGLVDGQAVYEVTSNNYSCNLFCTGNGWYLM